MPAAISVAVLLALASDAHRNGTHGIDRKAWRLSMTLNGVAGRIALCALTRGMSVCATVLHVPGILGCSTP
eukprot:2548255-Pleurochrysis_carterae.AAC.4